MKDGERVHDLQTAAERLRALERQTRQPGHGGQVARLPGNACFLDDGRVLCRERTIGDSRYPYGRDGLHFWVHASGVMHGNKGLFFIFLPFQDGQDPQIAFFVGQRQPAGGEYLPISLLPVPYLESSEPRVTNRYTVIGHDATYFVTETAELRATLRVFVHQPPTGEVRILFSSCIENTTAGPLDLCASAYLDPFCRHQFGQSSEDRWFKRVEAIASPDAAAATVGDKSAETPVPLAPFVVAVNESVSRFQTLTNYAVVRRSAALSRAAEWHAAQVCTSRLGYMGSPRIALGQARCLRTGRFEREIPVTVFNDNAVVGDLSRFRLPPRGWARFDYDFTLPASDDMRVSRLQTPLSAAAVDDGLAQVQAELAATPHDLDLQVRDSCWPGIADATCNGFFPFLTAQVRVCAETRGYMQPAPNSIVGIRDVFQAVEGHMYDRPAAAKEKMREALGFVLTDGRCPRQYSLPVNGTPGRADLREFIDQGAWVISTIHAYLALTGDAAFLEDVLGYHRLSDADATMLVPATDRDTVLEHLLRIMGYLARNRDPETKLLLALYGDWNDALDGLGTTDEPGRTFGTGVSVMASLQFYQNCTELIEILGRYAPGRHDEAIRQYTAVRAELEAGLLQYAVHTRGTERRIVHGWGDRRRYCVGSFGDSDGLARDGVTSNAFWVLSGMLQRTPELREPILAAFSRLDSPFGLKTFEPGFGPDAPGVGRIPKLPIGTAGKRGHVPARHAVRHRRPVPAG